MSLSSNKSCYIVLHHHFLFFKLYNQCCHEFKSSQFSLQIFYVIADSIFLSYIKRVKRIQNINISACITLFCYRCIFFFFFGLFLSKKVLWFQYINEWLDFYQFLTMRHYLKACQCSKIDSSWTCSHTKEQ